MVLKLTDSGRSNYINITYVTVVCLYCITTKLKIIDYSVLLLKKFKSLRTNLAFVVYNNIIYKSCVLFSTFSDVITIILENITATKVMEIF